MQIRKGFTLIELLIVVAIIAILAAIAVPNFLEAQTRSKVSRTHADMRSMATALETYHVDNNSYLDTPVPPFLWEYGSGLWCYSRLTTPIAYMTSVPRDPFSLTRKLIGTMPASKNGFAKDGVFTYRCWLTWNPVILNKFFGDASGFVVDNLRWCMESPGPNLIYEDAPNKTMTYTDFIYDPTNGTISVGDIVRTAAGIRGGGLFQWPNPGGTAP